MIFGSQGPSFRNGFWASSSLCTLKISASAIELGVEDFFVTTGTQFSSTVSEPAVVYVHWRFQRHRRTAFRGWILGHQGLSFRQRFLSQQQFMCTEDVSVSRRTWLHVWFLGPRDQVFFNGCRASSSLCPLKISASAVELGFKDDFWDSRDSIFVNGFSVNRSLCA